MPIGGPSGLSGPGKKSSPSVGKKQDALKGSGLPKGDKSSKKSGTSPLDKLGGKDMANFKGLGLPGMGGQKGEKGGENGSDVMDVGGMIKGIMEKVMGKLGGLGGLGGMMGSGDDAAASSTASKDENVTDLGDMFGLGTLLESLLGMFMGGGEGGLGGLLGGSPETGGDTTNTKNNVNIQKKVNGKDVPV